jgi:hypothetical protein
MTQPPPPPPPGQPIQLRFSSPAALFVFCQLDRAILDLQNNVGQCLFVGQTAAAQLFQKFADQLAAARDEFHRNDQGAIVLAGPGALPRP